MAIRSFAFDRAADVAGAVASLRAADDARCIAGGQSLLGAMKLGQATPARLVDIARLPGLRGVGERDGIVRIGATTTHAEVARSELVQRRIPALARLADLIGDPAVRARGTLGGSLANNDPAACYPAAVLALGATIHTERRAIAADDFFVGVYQTALEADEIVVAVEFPVPQRAAWVKFRQPASRFALVGVFVARTLPAAVRVAATGAGPGVFRVSALEAALAADFTPAACDRVRVSADGLTSDQHASASFRAHLIGALAKRAVAEIV
jgi:carbon-monoxide dehydrogenase medium subunit